jgi:bifunctional DNA-binding transcriptional regulator/antitoxin component of YhaV-PrlF toxin-antitoxin module
MFRIKMSSKRQATFPKKVCDSLGVQAGDDLLLDRHVENDREVWVLRPAREMSRPWLGSLREYASGKDHDMDRIRESVSRLRGAGHG